MKAIQFWKPIRVSLLVLTFGGVLVVAGKSIFGSTPDKSTAKTFEFPKDVPLSGWQAIGSQPLTEPLGRTYQYSQGNLNLAIEMRYVDYPHTNEKLFRQYDPNLVASNKSPRILRQRETIGAYSLSVDEGRAYLRTCINPRGDSAITYSEFIRNRYTSDLQLSRLLPWLMGQESLRDHRCLWTYLSLPIQDSSPEQAYQVLENTFLPWYQWWHSRFPE